MVIAPLAIKQNSEALCMDDLSAWILILVAWGFGLWMGARITFARPTLVKELFEPKKVG